MHELDLAYIAGFFDGEGSVGIYNCKNHGNGRGRLTDVRLCFANTDRQTLEWIQSTLNCAGKIKQIKGKNRAGYQLTYSAVRAKEVLEILLPYLRQKKRQAELTIQYQVRKSIGNSHLGEEEWAIRDRIQAEVKRLKHEPSP